MCVGRRHFRCLSLMPAELGDAIEDFLRRCRRPALLEAGSPIVPLVEGEYVLDRQPHRLTLQVWTARSNVVRRVVGVVSQAPGRLILSVERFARKQGELELFDLERAAPGHQCRGLRLVWRERFRLMLSREMPAWTLAELSTEPDLEHTLSPAFVRALAVRGTSGVAILGAGPQALDPDSLLTFGLIWFDHLRRHRRRLTIERLDLWLPHGSHNATALRMPWMRLPMHLHLYTEDDFSQQVDPADCGNVDTSLAPRASVIALPWEGTRELAAIDGVDLVDLANGALSLRVRGLEFARWQTELTASLGSRRAITVKEAAALAQSLSRFRSPDPPDARHSLYRRHPEAWLESQLRRNIEVIDPSLASAPVYGQVPALAAADRGILDLLTCDHTGRLAVVEIKAVADPHLPLQALDYWLRVRWHLERGEFTAAGYFPGMALRKEAPRLVLVAPALEFHPSTETVLQYFKQAIPVERIGVGARWRHRLEIMFRLNSAERPY